MHDHSSPTVLERVRLALGRTAPLKSAPQPPPIEEPIARLVYSTVGLPGLFAKRAEEMKMLVEPVRVDDLADRIAGFLNEARCRRVMLSDTPLLRRLRIGAALGAGGFQPRWWSEITADEAYDFDAGVTEIDYAVAETGTLAIRHRPEHGRLLSLVPFVHVAVVEPKRMLPDLIDLFEALGRDGVGSGVTLISGPSKTADIEMNTITGVHGPNIVKAFVLS